ncbi:phosphotransferase family protein [Sphingomonas qilianensis]|uniref:Phosphotransferase n=1 Tax=Sphingomonas qilianensis TaxID=1736690 RepID=A0ABU9XSJ1_9SPHN
MILTRHNVLPYLVQAELFGLDRIVAGRVQVGSRTSRNRAFAVSDARGPGLFVKQFRPEEGHWNRGSTVESEAQVYRMAAGNDRLEAVIPRLRSFDASHQILVLDLVEPAETLRAHQRRTGHISVSAAAALGSALATCHVEFGKVLRFGTADATAPALPRHRAWILRPDLLDPYVTVSQSAAQAQVVAIVQRHPDLVDRLRALASAWRVNGVIHGDMKWANCLIGAGGAGPDDHAVRLIDWEMAGSGDVAWDVGGIFQSCILAWVRSTRGQAGDGVGALVASATVSLDGVQAAARAFFFAYLNRIDLDPRATAALLARSVGYAAARIVQTAFEATSGEALISGHMVLALQLAANMLADPAEAAAQVLGIEP